MCGIAGFFDPSATQSIDKLTAVISRMNATLTHRGPDDSGLWIDEQAGITLGHRRLSIIDLSLEGHQPMSSHSGRYVIVYNGEVYNYLEMRKELDAEAECIHWRGHSDTEVILAAIEAWGLEAAVKRFIGMFAFVLWDKHERCLHLVRDRLGIKPLYYGWVNGVFVFVS
jgi:asparagine synthase (glutamine-hydrolysing)